MLSSERIVEIARQAASRRGYAIYADYDDDLRHEICVERTLEPTQAGFYQYTIKRALVEAGWRWRPRGGGLPSRFYPPA